MVFSSSERAVGLTNVSRRLLGTTNAVRSWGIEGDGGRVALEARRDVSQFT